MEMTRIEARESGVVGLPGGGGICGGGSGGWCDACWERCRRRRGRGDREQGWAVVSDGVEGAVSLSTAWSFLGNSHAATLPVVQ